MSVSVLCSYIVTFFVGRAFGFLDGRKSVLRGHQGPSGELPPPPSNFKHYKRGPMP